MLLVQRTGVAAPSGTTRRHPVQAVPVARTASMDHTAPDVIAAVSALDQALDGLLEARIHLVGLDELDTPFMALDLGLRGSLAHRRARARLDERVRAFRDLVPRELVPDVLALEEAATEVSVSASDVGFRLGVALARGRRGDA